MASQVSQCRIALGGMFNESTHFLTTTAGINHWRDTCVLAGDEVLSLAGAANEDAGVLKVLLASDAQIVPLQVARSIPSGPTTREAYEVLKGGILDRLTQALPVDGVILTMHGSMTIVNEDDPEGDVLESVRRIVGPAVPIVATLDLHANITQRMVESSDALVAYTHYPHDDTFTTGERAARLLLETIAGRVRPVMAMVKVPLVTGALRGMTFGNGPMARLETKARALEAEPGVLSVSILQVHPTNDMPGMGSGGLVVADDDSVLAERLATSLADEMWAMRRDFEVTLTSLPAAIEEGLAINGSVVLVDAADCVGGGASGDSVAVLRQLLNISPPIPATLLMVVDPSAAETCATAGVGAVVSLSLGYAIDPSWGTPLEVTGTVRRILNGDFTYTGGPFGGTVGRMGQSAVLSIGDIEILITTRGTYDWMDEQYRAAGLDPEAAKFIGAKNPMNFRFAYPNARGVFILDTPGPTPPSTKVLPYRRLQRPFFPFDEDIPGLTPTVFANRGIRQG